MHSCPSCGCVWCVLAVPLGFWLFHAFKLTHAFSGEERIRDVKMAMPRCPDYIGVVLVWFSGDKLVRGGRKGTEQRALKLKPRTQYHLYREDHCV